MNSNNKIQQFHNREFGTLDILMIDGKPYFPAAESATILGYSNPRKAIIDHCKNDGVTNRDVIDRLGRKQGKKYINEGNLYRLIARSKLPAAERFETWVFDEVLPTIRKYGAYATSEILDEIRRSPEFAETLFQKLEKEREKNAVLEELATDMAPKALYCDVILKCKDVVPVSLIAKDYGVSAVSFNNLLHGFGIQYKVGGTWVLYQKYAWKGYTRTRTYLLNGFTASVRTCWTQKGRMFLYEFLKSFDILPVMETAQAHIS
ncbi:MAG: phage antirepressor [Christensenellaceae bacterium]|jgi:prophage antirepressor-like protein